MSVSAKYADVSLSMLPNASPAHPSAAVSRLQHRLHAEIAARRQVERENLRLRLQLQTVLRRLARRGERSAVTTPQTEVPAPVVTQPVAEIVAAPVPDRVHEAVLYASVARSSTGSQHDAGALPDGNLQRALREALQRRSGA